MDDHFEFPFLEECRNEKTPEQIQAEIEDLLSRSFWLPTINQDVSYSRYEDDSPNGHINVIFSCDGDAWIWVTPDRNHDQFSDSCRFRVPFIGGGQSHRVRMAMMILAEAIRLDNEERPQNRSL